MSRKALSRCAIPAALAGFCGYAASGAQGAAFDWATVGHAGNAANSTNGRGAVAYEFRISKYEVTNAQYAEFLNAIAASDPAGLYNSNMGSDARGGITRSGSSGSYSYSVKANMGEKPVIYVSWLDAARFVNWLHNGQGDGSTEFGAYEIGGGLSETRSAEARYFIPSHDEWYKAAWHQPAEEGGDSDGYWLYATGSNADPTPAIADAAGNVSNAGINVANYDLEADWNGQDGNITTVGSAGADSASYYGTFDQSGNVWEWNEALIVRFGTFHPTQRGIWGGSWGDEAATLRSTYQPDSLNWAGRGPATERDDLGFRIAAPIPEPTTVAALGLGAVWHLRRRRD